MQKLPKNEQFLPNRQILCLLFCFFLLKMLFFTIAQHFYFIFSILIATKRPYFQINTVYFYLLVLK